MNPHTWDAMVDQPADKKEEQNKLCVKTCL